MRVLYVEDNEVNQALVARVMRARQNKVVFCEEGESALEILADDAEIELVLLDIELAGIMSGLDVVRTLRARNDRRPVVAITAYAMMGDRERILEAGCDQYLPKPLVIPDLLKLLDHYETVIAQQSAAPAPAAQTPTPAAVPAASAQPETPATSASATPAPTAETAAASGAVDAATTQSEPGVTAQPAADAAETAETATETVTASVADSAAQAPAVVPAAPAADSAAESATPAAGPVSEVTPSAAPADQTPAPAASGNSAPAPATAAPAATEAESAARPDAKTTAPVPPAPVAARPVDSALVEPVEETPHD